MILLFDILLALVLGVLFALLFGALFNGRDGAPPQPPSRGSPCLRSVSSLTGGPGRSPPAPAGRGPHAAPSPPCR